MDFKFVAGQPACPVACQYCFITEHDTRRAQWNEKHLLGINKACTYLNVSSFIDDDVAEQQAIIGFDWSLLRGDHVGFTAISDPFWPKLEKWLWLWLENASGQAKLVTCVSKWPISDRVMKKLAEVPNFRLVISITGAEKPVEKVSIRAHLKTLEKAKELGVPTRPICHPYIPGISDLNFLPQIRKMGYERISVKGLRYDLRMAVFIPREVVKQYYEGNGHLEILPEDGWRERVADAGLSLESPKEWYIRTAPLTPRQTTDEAARCVRRIMNLAQVTSSSSSQAVYEAAVKRRV